MPQSNYDVNINIKTTDKTSGTSKKVARGLGDVAKAASAIGAAMAASQVVKYAVELGKLGIAAQAAGNRFEKFAGGPERAGMFLEAFNEGADRTVDKMTAMTSAGRLLQMGLVENAGEMESIAAMATKLGDQTEDAGARISGFAAMLANQSIPRLDNYGISSGRVRQRIDELLKSGQALNREQAFKMAVMEEGAKALDILGDTSDTTAQKIAVLKAAVQDAKIGMGELIVSVVDGAGSVEGFAARIRGIPETLTQIGMLSRATWQGMQAAEAAGFSVAAGVDEFTNSLKRSVAAQTDFGTASEISRYAHATALPTYEKEVALMEALTRSTEYYAQANGTMERSVGDSIDSFNQYQQALEMAEQATNTMVESTDELAQGLDATAQLQMSMAFTRQLDSMQESSAQFAKNREQIEADHQVKIAELQKRGQATAIQLNVAVENEKLAALQFKLDQRQRKVDEMTGKEKESVRIAKEHALSEAQAEYNEQQVLLDNYHAGRLTRQGENVTAMIEEENRRKDAALAALDEQMAKQQQLQEQQMGQMLLQTFDQWGEQKDIPVEKMIEMRTAIAEEYGLVSEGATELVTDMVGEWDRWANNTEVATSDVVGYMGAVITETGKVQTELLELTAEEYVIKVRYEISGAPNGGGDIPKPKKTGAFQHGGTFMVGEGGPEMVTVQPLSNTITNNDTFNIYDGRAMAAVTENRRRQRRSGYARTM